MARNSSFTILEGRTRIQPSKFKVTQGGSGKRDQESEWQKQRTGIRQGFPSSHHNSLHLFILTLYVMCHDVQKQFHDTRHQQPFQTSNFQEFPRTVVCRRWSKSLNILAKSATGRPAKFYFIGFDRKQSKF